MDPQVVRREIADATNVHPHDLDRAAKELGGRAAVPTNGHQAPPTPLVHEDSKKQRRGFTIQDMRDFNDQQRRNKDVGGRGNGSARNAVIDFT